MTPTPEEIETVVIWLKGLSTNYDLAKGDGPYHIRRNSYEFSDQFSLSVYLNKEEGSLRICVDDMDIERPYVATEKALLHGLNEVARMAAEKQNGLSNP